MPKKESLGGKESETKRLASREGKVAHAQEIAICDRRVFSGLPIQTCIPSCIPTENPLPSLHISPRKFVGLAPTTRWVSLHSAHWNDNFKEY